MVCIVTRAASVRSGGAGDAGGIVKPARRGSRGSGDDPKGRLIKTLGLRRPSLAMRPASRLDGLLAQDLDKTVQTPSSFETGSNQTGLVAWGETGITCLRTAGSWPDKHGGDQ